MLINVLHDVALESCHVVLPKTAATYQIKHWNNPKQEARHKVGVGETPRRFVLKRCRYSLHKLFEDAFDTAFVLVPHCIMLNADKAVRCGIFGRFSNLDKCRPEAAGDVISGKTFRLCRRRCPCKRWWFSVKQWSNYFTLCPAGPVLRTFVQYLIAFYSRPEASGDVIFGRFWGLLSSINV